MMPTSAEENKATVLRTLEGVFVRKDPDAILEGAAPDEVLHLAGFPEPVRGAQAIRDWAAGQLAAFDSRVTVEDILAEGDTVVVRSTFQLVHRGEYLGIPPTGRELTFTQLEMVRFAGGRIQESWVSLDTLSVLQQLGVFPAGRPPRPLLKLIIGLRGPGRPDEPVERQRTVPPPPAPPPGSNPDAVAAANKATALRYTDEVFEKRNVAANREILAPDAVFHVPGYPEPFRGAQAMEDWSASYLAAFDSQLEVHDVVAEGDLVALRFTVRGRHVGDGYLGIPATGRRVEFTEFSLTRYADGLAQEGWLSLDTLGVMQQLGLFPKGQPPRWLMRLVVGLQRPRRKKG